MKAAIFNPYLDTLGGGERYAMGVAQVFVNKGYQVDVQWESSSIKHKLEKRFNINLSSINFVKDIRKGKGYDICFWVSDGSIPLLYGRKNLLHFQVPFKDVKGKMPSNKMKLLKIGQIICNSQFTKKHIDKEYGVNSIVIYPPVAVDKFKPKQKENLIISIGRFSQLKQAKRQDVLIRAFKKLYDAGLNDWKMVLAGGTEVGVGDYLEELRKLAKGYPINVMESPSFNQIQDLYGRSKVFWSASGYGIDENKEPERVEHFGITLVEAMAAKATLVVYKAGGHKEIIENGKNGLLWTNLENLVSKTKKIIENESRAETLLSRAFNDSKMYGYERFEKELQNIIEK